MSTTNNERADFPSLYERTGDITDINTLLVPRADLAANAPAAEPVAWQCRHVTATFWQECSETTAQARASRPEKWEVRALYTAPPALTDQWMPIETAPKDKALLTHDGVSYNLAHFNTALGKWIANHPYDERLPREPIRWTLLPPHPRSGTAAQVAQEGAPGVEGTDETKGGA